MTAFGAAAAVRTPRDDTPCPCGSGETYGGCCGPVHRGAAAPTAEALMRSRYTAFAIGDERHLLLTWHPRTRPREAALEPGLQWTRLEVVATQGGGAEEATGVVEFRAHWRAAGESGILHERSRFARVRGRWTYVDGAGS